MPFNTMVRLMTYSLLSRSSSVAAAACSSESPSVVVGDVSTARSFSVESAPNSPLLNGSSGVVATTRSNGLVSASANDPLPVRSFSSEPASTYSLLNASNSVAATTRLSAPVPRSANGASAVRSFSSEGASTSMDVLPQQCLDSIDTHFPGALPVPVFLDALKESMNARFGWTRENCIPSMALCRDEFSANLIREVQARWGLPFLFSSLGGFIHAGPSGVTAMASHAPNFDGIERFLIVGVSHIGMLPSGELGACHRSGQVTASSCSPMETPTCGALRVFEGKLHSETGFVPSEGDTEVNLMAQRLLPLIDMNNKPTIIELTKMVSQIIYKDLLKVAKQVVQNPKKQQAAIINGVQIHAPQHMELIHLDKCHMYGGQEECLWPLPEE